MAPPAEPTNLRVPLWSHVTIIEKSPAGVAMAQAALAQNKTKNVSLPSGSASFASSSASTKKRRGEGPNTTLEKAWVNDLRKQLD